MHNKVAIIIGFVLALIISAVIVANFGLIEKIDTRSDLQSIVAFLAFFILWIICALGVYSLLNRFLKIEEL